MTSSISVCFSSQFAVSLLHTDTYSICQRQHSLIKFRQFRIVCRVITEVKVCVVSTVWDSQHHSLDLFPSLSFADGWSILLQHPVPVAFEPSRPPPGNGLFPPRASTYQHRAIPLSPCSDTENVPTWRLSRRPAGPETTFSFRGQAVHVQILMPYRTFNISWPLH